MSDKDYERVWRQTNEEYRRIEKKYGSKQWNDIFDRILKTEYGLSFGKRGRG